MKFSLKPMLSFLLLSFFYVSSFSQYKLTDPVPVDPNVKVGKLAQRAYLLYPQKCKT